MALLWFYLDTSKWVRIDHGIRADALFRRDVPDAVDLLANVVRT